MNKYQGPIRSVWQRNFRLVLLLSALVCLVLSCGHQAMAAQWCNWSITPSAPTSDFVVNGDGTVTHSKTGLMWKRCAEGQVWNGTSCTGASAYYSWQGGLQQVEALNKAGGFATYADWRLPNIKELNSIVEERCSYPALNEAIFPGIARGAYWSSSPVSTDKTRANMVYFYNNGFSEMDAKFRFHHILLVRGE